MFNTKTKQILLCTLLMAFLPGMAIAQNFTPHSLLSEGQWFKIPISNTGVYKITIDNLPALNNTLCSQIALYSTPGEMLSTSTRDLANDDLMPVATEIADNNNNGIFDAATVDTNDNHTFIDDQKYDVSDLHLGVNNVEFEI